MSKLKAGDKVRCIDNSLAKDYFVLGESLIIDRVPYAGHVCFDHTGHRVWCVDRFELIEKENTVKETKQFNPKPGDKIICNNGEEYTCCTYDFLLKKGCAVKGYPEDGTFAYHPDACNTTTGVSWIFSRLNKNGNWDIREVIPAQKEEIKPELTYTVEDIRKACIDDLGWLEHSYDLLLQSLKKVTHPEYDEYIRLKAVFESEQEDL